MNFFHPTSFNPTNFYKPVNFVWMERKVTEWGCMQALIDFDGWRKWNGGRSRQHKYQNIEKKKKVRTSKTMRRNENQREQIQQRQSIIVRKKEKKGGRRRSANRLSPSTPSLRNTSHKTFVIGDQSQKFFSFFEQCRESESG